jgi:hypothetical protein
MSKPTAVDHDNMQKIARGLDTILNGDGARKTGFVLLVMPLDAPEGACTNYVSNCNRKDILVALKEIVARFEGQPEARGRA